MLSSCDLSYAKASVTVPAGKMAAASSSRYNSRKSVDQQTKKVSTNNSVGCVTKRWTFACMASLCITMNYILRVDINMALVGMVNHTALALLAMEEQMAERAPLTYRDARSSPQAFNNASLEQILKDVFQESLSTCEYPSHDENVYPVMDPLPVTSYPFPDFPGFFWFTTSTTPQPSVDVVNPKRNVTTMIAFYLKLIISA